MISICKLFTGVPVSDIASLFIIFVSNVGYAFSIVLVVRLLIIVVSSILSSSSSVDSSANILQIFFRWGTTSLKKLVIDYVYLFYLFLILLPLIIIQVIVAVAADASMCPVGPSNSSFF